MPNLNSTFTHWTGSGGYPPPEPVQAATEPLVECARCLQHCRPEFLSVRHGAHISADGWDHALLCDECSDVVFDMWDDGEAFSDDGEAEVEVFEADAPDTEEGPALWIPALDNRQARLLSFEQEVSRGGHTASQHLYNAGMTSYPEMRGYHAGPSGASEFCYVERDASVDGEIIWPKLKLHLQSTALRFEQGLTVVRDLIRDGEVALSMHCGGHMHVDARGLTMDNIMSLYIMWNHVEDFMFRIAAANWSAHRSVTGNDYSSRIPKGFERSRDVWNNMQSHRGSLNIGNILAARANCHCGATQVGDWSQCTCSGLRKPTVEFRVWNTTANLTKVHAYTALSIAMVEWARLNQASPDTFPVHEWTGSPTASAPNVEQPMRFVLEELPLTDRERASVQYCIDRCSIAELNL